MLVSGLKNAILEQRDRLTALLGKPMFKLAGHCAEAMDERASLEALLRESLAGIIGCKHLYVLDSDGLQLTNNITRDGDDPDHFGRDRANRPYMQGILGVTDFKLSEAYISRNKKRPSLTAVQVIRDAGGHHTGFLGADYDLRELPGADQVIYQEPQAWRQIKGDPAIRGGLFLQQRVQSLMDDRLDDILPLMTELMTEHCVFHGKLHFASSRATIWLADDPWSYRILGINELSDPDICLAYPRRPAVERAIVAPEQIAPVFEMFRRLRFADDTVYLRAGSLNICNGMIGLNFSCDGSHYLSYDELLEKGLEFWFGALSS